ncbi:CPBP family intramembrane metalloprotease [bacterium]|nr:CPBP family intramembrane metalloprotease [bacterium]
MNKKQKWAVVAPSVLLITTVPLFRMLSKIMDPTVGWYSGLALYWLTWCGLFPLWLVGKKPLCRIIRPRKPERSTLFFLIIPIVGSFSYKLISGMDYGRPDIGLFLLIISTAFGNGFFEEVLWRGVYMDLFPDNLFFRIFWPSLWFALWHYAPGSVSPNANIAALMIGSGIFGFYLSFLAKKANTIWWCIVAHTIGGIIMII